MRNYNTGVLFIQLIHCNGESTPLIDAIKNNLNAYLNFSNPGDHVPDVECNNQTIEE